MRGTGHATTFIDPQSSKAALLSHPPARGYGYTGAVLYFCSPNYDSRTSRCRIFDKSESYRATDAVRKISVLALRHLKGFKGGFSKLRNSVSLYISRLGRYSPRSRRGEEASPGGEALSHAGHAKRNQRRTKTPETLQSNWPQDPAMILEVHRSHSVPNKNAIITI